MRQMMRVLSVATLSLLVSIAVGAQTADEDRVASEDCALCHEEIAAVLQQTIHGVAARGGPSCVTCHGDGTRHMDEGGDPELITVPSGTSGEEICLACHDRIHTMFSSRSAHSDTAVFCGDCHAVHAESVLSYKLLTQHPNPLCAACHAHQWNSFRRPYGHRLDRGGLECVSCHNPHGGSGERSLVVDRSGEGPCLSCHAEKRGPFVFPHVSGLTGDCTSCHQPHGSSNPMALLRARVDQLCLECHSPAIGGGTLGSQPPSSHDLLIPRYRNCTVCHVAIHGSNLSPTLLK